MFEQRVLWLGGPLEAIRRNMAFPAVRGLEEELINSVVRGAGFSNAEDRSDAWKPVVEHVVWTCV